MAMVTHSCCSRAVVVPSGWAEAIPAGDQNQDHGDQAAEDTRTWPPRRLFLVSG
jgi:hypothetical protein